MTICDKYSVTTSYSSPTLPLTRQRAPYSVRNLLLHNYPYRSSQFKIISPQPHHRPHQITLPPDKGNNSTNQTSLPEPVTPPKILQIEGPRTTKLSISFVSTTVFQCAYRVKGAVTFQLSSRSQILTGQAADIHPENPDLSNVPKEYWQFADIFCKWKAKSLPVHCFYDLTIQIEEGAISPLRPIYFLSSIELQIL